MKYIKTRLLNKYIVTGFRKNNLNELYLLCEDEKGNQCKVDMKIVLSSDLDIIESYKFYLSNNKSKKKKKVGKKSRMGIVLETETGQRIRDAISNVTFFRSEPASDRFLTYRSPFDDCFGA